MTNPPTILVFSPHPSSWRWYEADTANRVNWLFHTEEPQSVLERKITKPRLSRIVGALRCARQAKQRTASALAAHSQFSTFWSSLALRVFGANVPLLSFSFHYARLPEGLRLTLAKWAFARVTRFVVHSEAERSRYANHFSIPKDRFQLVRWGVEPSSTLIGEGPPLIPGVYVCAVGKDGRDYRTLIEAMRDLPEMRLIVVAQPHNLQDVKIPDNVQVLCNIPMDQAMNILKNSLFMALPLETDTTSCGHITIVSAMFCKKAIVATGSEGISDYFPDDYAAPSVRAGDVDGWKVALSSMARDAAMRMQCEHVGYNFAYENCSHDAALRSSLSVFEAAGVPIP